MTTTQMDLLTMRTATQACALLALLTGALQAQHGTDYLREHFRNAAFAELEGVKYRVETNGSAQGAAMRLLSLDGTVLSTVSLPWHYEGGMTVAGDQVLAGGLRLGTSRTGVLGRVTISTSSGVASLSLSSHSDYATLDPVVIHADSTGKGVFIVDAVGNRLLHGAVSGFPAQAGSFAVAADALSMPLLADKAVGAYIRLAHADADHSETLTALDVRSWQDSSAGYEVKSSATGWAVQTLGDAGAMWLSRSAAISVVDAGAYWLPSTLQTGTVNLLAPNGAIVTSVVANSGSWNAVPVSPLFSDMPGLQFRLEHAQTGRYVNVLPLHSVGNPTSVSQLTVERGRVWPNAVLGNHEFGSGVGISTTATQTFLVGASMAFRQPTGDPIDANGFLVPDAFVSFVVDPAVAGESVGLGLPLPSDQGLDGEVVLFQYLFLLPDQSLARSDVFGVTLQWKGGADGLAASSSEDSDASVTPRERLMNAWTAGRISLPSVFAQMTAAWND